MICVIYRNPRVVYNFIKHEIISRNDKIKSVNKIDEIVKYINGTVYLPVNSREQLLGLEFEEVLVSPCYSDLLFEAKLRVRRK